MEANATTEPGRSARRHLLVLACGLGAGLLLGPAVLGQITPSLYGRLFVWGQEGAALRAEIRSLETGLDQRMRNLEGREGKRAAPERIVAATQREQKRLAQAREELKTQKDRHRRAYTSGLRALVLAVLLFMVTEAVLGVPGGAALDAARYALMALWVAGVTAKPALLADLPWVLFVLLIAVAFAGVMMPARGNSTDQEP